MPVTVALTSRTEAGAALTQAQHDNNIALIEAGFAACAHTDHTHDYTDFAGLSDALAAKIPIAQKGAVNGVATLDASTKVPLAQITGVLNTEDVNGLDDALNDKVDTTVLGNITGAQYVEATLVAGTIAVSLAGFTTAHKVHAFHQSVGGTPGFLVCSHKETGGFTILSGNPADTSVIGCIITTVS